MPNVARTTVAFKNCLQSPCKGALEIKEKALSYFSYFFTCQKSNAMHSHACKLCLLACGILVRFVNFDPTLTNMLPYQPNVLFFLSEINFLNQC